MTSHEKIQRGFVTRIRRTDVPDAYTVSYAPRGMAHRREAGGESTRVPSDFKARVEVQGDRYTVSWMRPPQDPEASQEEFEQDAIGRVKTLQQWRDFLLATLLGPIRRWADELGWSHRQVEKLMNAEIADDYPVPGLLLQEGLVRIAVEPIGRSAPGAEGIVDLYLMPAYDDIASLYYYDGRWNLHYVVPGAPAVATVREAASKPLSKEALHEVLDAMKSHAA